jgi:protein-tyrosine kinase
MSTVIRQPRRGRVVPAEGSISPDQRSDALLGRLLLDAGKLKQVDVNRVAQTQREKNLSFGEAAARLGLVSKDDVSKALAQQFRYPYVTGESFLHPTLVAAYRPFSATAEALRELRSQLQLRWFDQNRRPLAVVSARKRSGCSRLAANLAIVFSQLGERTLLIDANFRRASQQTLFGVQQGVGLSDFLAGRCSLGDAFTTAPPFEDLKLLCAGTQPPNPQELLGQGTFQYLLEIAPANFDVVIIDTPPILEFADAQMIAAAAGGCLLTARRHQTRLAEVERAKERLEPARAVLVGTTILG